MNKETFNKYRFDIVKNLTLKKESLSSHTNYEVRYKTPSKVCIIGCCRTCFRNVYMLSEYMLNKIKGLDDNYDINHRNSSSDNLERINGQELADYYEECNINNPDFHIDFLPAVMCPRGPKAERCVAWLIDNFYLYGDQQPNSKILYIPEGRKKDLYRDYENSDDPVSNNDTNDDPLLLCKIAMFDP